MTAVLAGLGRVLGQADGMAPMWLANVAIAAPLLRFRSIGRRSALVGATIGFIIVYAATASSLAIAAPQLAANIGEIVVTLVLVDTLRDATTPLYLPRNLLLFFAAGGIAAPAIAAVIGAGSLALLEDAQVTTVASRWFAADALGMVILGPLILSAGCSDNAVLVRSRRRWETVPVALLAAAATLFVFGAARYPALFLILPAIIVAIFRLRFIGAAVSILTVTVVATVETARGVGPIAQTFSQIDHRLLFLQIFLAVLVASTLPMAAILVEREGTLRRLAERERQYRLLADYSNDMIVRIGLDGVRRFVSPACRTILGIEPEEMVGMTPIAAIHPEDRARVESVCRSLLTGAVDPVCSYRQRRRDGTYVWLEATYRLVRDEIGRPREFVASVRDVARRRRAELETASAMARLHENYRLLNMAEALAGIGHWRLDAINHDLFWSDEVSRIHGRAVGDLPTLAEAIHAYHPDDRAAVQRDVDDALARGKPWTFRARIRRPDGGVRHVESSGQAEMAPDGTIIGVVGVFRDITDEIETAAELIAARDAARASAEAKSAFLAAMSHEIRTPMTGVLGMIELLRGHPDKEERARLIGNLERSAKLLMTILDDVLDFSKIESGKLMIECVDLDLDQLCRETVDLFYHAAASKGLSLTMSSPPGIDPRVRGDPIRIQQIISNLVSNAIKFTSQGSVELRLTIQPDGNNHRSVVLEVIDTGIGMDQQTSDRIYAPFIQADASTTRRFGGTGLGLAITRRLVDAMQGTIVIDSQPGRGSRFTVALTLDIAETVSQQPIRLAPNRRGRSLSILLAEDNAINRTLIEALVQLDGHRVSSVENGRLAVAAAERERFDVILMDMQMPEMDGLAATRVIQDGSGPNTGTPVVALSADAVPARRQRYEHAGLTAFLTKPIDADLLLNTLQAVTTADGQTAGVADQNPSPLLDNGRLQDVATVVGPESAVKIVSMARVELVTKPGMIAGMIAEGKLDAASAAAHSFRGAVSVVGCLEVIRIAVSIEQACQAGRAADDLAMQLLVAAEATNLELGQWTA
ncbi:PAS domain S-box-containing protein [Sphingomonas jinjuensis]|uniref:histidine kinase n=1 Tax=Sphingomonas jinjuensis TaxID=535907 RepID=A0A840FF04_9SPHN|nr:PAS domain S-box-containing protein [Sphingomonas jinjuensis]